MTPLEVRILDARIKDNMPAYGTAGAAGLDLRACIDDADRLLPRAQHLMGQGRSIQVTRGPVTVARGR